MLVCSALNTCYARIYRFTSISGQDASKPIPYDPKAPVTDQVFKSFETSLRNLRTTYLDSYVLHGPLETLAQTKEAWKAMGSLQDAGKVRLVGISNAYDVDILKALAVDRPIQVVQNRWYEGNAWDREVVRYCKREGIMYQCVIALHPFLLNRKNNK